MPTSSASYTTELGQSKLVIHFVYSMNCLIFTQLSSKCFAMKNHLIGILLFTPSLTISSRDAVFLDEILVFQRSTRHCWKPQLCENLTGRSIFLEPVSHDSTPNKFPENHGRIICKQCFNKEECTGLTTRSNKRSIL